MFPAISLVFPFCLVFLGWKIRYAVWTGTSNAVQNTMAANEREMEEAELGTPSMEDVSKVRDTRAAPPAATWRHNIVTLLDRMSSSSALRRSAPT